MAKKKKAKRKTKPKAQAVKVLKITPIEPDKHLVELEVTGAPPLPNEPLPSGADVAALLPGESREEITGPEPLKAPHNSWLKWLKSLW